MNLLQSFVEALESLASNKLRSALTMLGIVIGVAAVIAMLAIGRGAQSSISSSIESIGTNVLYIMMGGDREIRNPKPLTLNDANALANRMNAPSIAAVAPYLQGMAEVSYSGTSVQTSLEGVTPAYARVSNLTTSEGTLISEADLVNRSAVVVIGTDVAKSLFGRTEKLTGATIRVGGQQFKVIGVLTSKGGSGFGSQDNRILVPLTTAQSRLLRRANRQEVDAIMVQAASAEKVESAIAEATAILNNSHHTTAGKEDFTIINQQDILSIASSVTGVLTTFLAGIGAISLLVGGIGIMNIMLVSVSERTREIGLRKALGARRGDILLQFLVESAMLSVIGGLVGIGLAWVIAFIVGQIAAANDVAIQPLIQMDVVLLATLFSAGVGLFFGFYPANRAARLEPVEALRSE
jgi:putative ABC transport system permease protein